MKKEKKISIQEAELTNNCPECFNQDLKLTFFQKHSHGRLYHRISPEISHELKCNKCGSIIYPVKWTQDIERSFDYYRKMVKPEASKIRFTMMFFVLVLLLIVLAGAGVYFLLQSVPIAN